MKKSNASFLPILSILLLFFVSSCNQSGKAGLTEKIKKTDTIKAKPVAEIPGTTIDTADYNKRLLALSNNDTT